MKCVLLIVALLCMFSTASATDYYVDANTGNDGDDGESLANAWLTLGYADGNIGAGDTLYLVNGTWTDDHFVFGIDGTVGNSIIVTAYNGTPTLNGSDDTGIGFTITGRDYIEISGITIHNFDDAIKGFGSVSHSNFTDLNIHNCSNGIEIRSAGPISHNLTVDNIYINDTTGHGIYFQLINDSVISNIHVRDTTGAGKSAIYIENMWDSTIRDSTTLRSKWSGLHLQGISGTLHYNVIDNISVDYAEHTGIDIHNAASDNIIQYCDVVNVPSGAIGIYLHNEAQTNNTVESCSVTDGVGTALAYVFEDNQHSYLLNSTATNFASYGLNLKWGNNHTFTNVTFTNTSALDINIIKNDGINPSGNNTFTYINFSTVKYTNIPEADTWINPTETNISFQVVTSPANITLNYTDGRQFEANGDAGGHTSIIITSVDTYLINITSTWQPSPNTTYFNRICTAYTNGTTLCPTAQYSDAILETLGVAS